MNSLSPADRLPADFAGHQRAFNATSGVIPAAIAVPLIIRVWTPAWFVAVWLGVYLAASALFIGLILRRPSNAVEQSWSIAISLVYCAVPISSVVWSDLQRDFYAATTVGVIFIAFEMTALPFLRIREWRIGVLLVGATITACALLVIHPVAALMFALVVIALVNATQRMRHLHDDLTEHLAVAEKTIRHDPLTGLLNRRGLDRVFEDLDEQDITVVLIDVDRFKLINDTHGHQVGDETLAAVADELRRRIPETFRLARVGGDEFVAVAPGNIDVQPSIADPVQVLTVVRGQECTIECHLSAGFSAGTNQDSAQRLLSEAGFAMRQSKRSETTLSAFGLELSERLDRTLQVAAIANGDNASGRFTPVGQPIVDNDGVIGCELLIRWQQPDGQIVSPADFLPMATEAGLMPAINQLMMEHAVKFAARFNNRPNAPFVSVNISAPSLGSHNFLDQIAALLQQHRVRPERLMIEVTETEQLASNNTWESAATDLRSLGVNLAIDDFGTGYSSIDRLQSLPISHLKFDQSLVQAVTGPFGLIVQGLASFAQAVNIGVIAEGIETLDEQESMRSFGISMFQGYLFHHPLPLDAVEALIIEEHTRVEASQR